MMRRPLAALVAVLLVGPAAATAQATRTWVSGVGDDVNPCSRTAPCKTFAGAISKTAAGGEIDALDPGGFGAVTITHSITIDGTAGFGSILASGVTSGIRVAAGAADVVVLRNISVNGAGTTLGQNGITFASGADLHVEGCTISNFSASGITATSGGTLTVEGTTIRAIAGSAIALGGATVATVDRSLLALGGTGISAAGTSKGSVRDTVITTFSTAGIATSDTAEVNVDHGMISGNAVGVNGGTGSMVRLSDVMTSQNGTGITGTVVSFGNNRITAGNTTSDGTPSSTLPQQ
jgi:hypothetical protein